MLFSKKLNFLFEKYALTNSAVAHHAQLDASLISRFRTGNRLPLRYSSQLDKLAKGIVACVSVPDDVETLYRTFDIAANNKSALESSIAQWFSAEDSLLKEKKSVTAIPSKVKLERKTHIKLNAFSQKLDILMKTLNISNIRLARNLSVDASLISRFRTGVRRPTSENQILIEMCNYFISLSHDYQTRTSLCRLIDISMTDEDGKLQDALLHWLLATNDIELDSPIDSFLEQLEMFPTQNTISSDSKDNTAFSVKTPTVRYIGLRGMRDAITRFLSECTSLDTPPKIKLYSDQCLEWLIGDPNYTRIWRHLFARLIEQGAQLEFILDIGHAKNTTLRGIDIWLPILLSGNVYSYIMTRPTCSRFSRSIFLAEGNFCATGDCVTSILDKAIYSFSRSQEMIDYSKLQFEALKCESIPLIQVYHKEDSEAFARTIENYYCVFDDSFVIIPSLPVFTLPEEILGSMLIREGISADERNSLISNMNNLRNMWISNIEQNHQTVFCVLPNNDELYSGTAPIAMIPFMLSRTICYTPADFVSHIQSTIDFLRRFEKLHIIVLPQLPFKNLSLLVKKARGRYAHDFVHRKWEHT